DDCGVNRRREGKRSYDSPHPLHRRQRSSAERRTPSRFRCARWASTAGPPDVQREENGLRRRSEGHAKRHKEWRPHVGRNQRNKKAADNGAERNGQLRPYPRHVSWSVDVLQCSTMSMGKRKRDRQPSMWVATTDLPTARSHPFYTRLNQLL